MASSIGPGGNFFQINQQIAKGPDSKTAENLRQTGGTANQQRTSSAPKAKGPGQEGGLQLSDAAQKSLATSHQDSIQGHEQELAQHAGLQESDPESGEAQDRKLKEGFERDQEEKAETTKQGTPLPEGHTLVRSLDGVEQVMAPDQVDKLEALDGDIDRVERELLSDVPEANLEAANRVLDTQLKDGLNKVAKLKPVPEAQDAGRMELKGAEFMADPLDIREPGNDRTQPMSLDFPDSMIEIAKENAATALANGQIGEENLLA